CQSLSRRRTRVTGKRCRRSAARSDRAHEMGDGKLTKTANFFDSASKSRLTVIPRCAKEQTHLAESLMGDPNGGRVRIWFLANCRVAGRRLHLSRDHPR